MLGAFLCYSSLQYLPPGILTFFAGVLAGALMLAAIGGIVEFTLLRRNYRLGRVPQILITYGLALVLTDVVRIIWGGRFYTVSLPRVFEGFVSFGPLRLPTYSLFLIVFAFCVYLALRFLVYHTRLGMIIRAIVYHREMVSAVGIDASKVFTFCPDAGYFSGRPGGRLVRSLEHYRSRHGHRHSGGELCHRDHRGSGESYRHAPGGTDRRRNLCVRHPASARS